MNQLAIFAKHWQPGQVKTRLARSVGADAAARLHQAFLRTLLARLRDCGQRRTVVYTPSDRGEDFADLAGVDWSIAPQADGDLGVRMRRYFETAMAQGASRVVLLGADSPTVPREHVDRAFEALATKEVVLGPSADGGYYLVGASRAVPPIFDEVAWGGPRVWRQTVHKLTAAGLGFEAMPEWYDVDTEADLARLTAELALAPDTQVSLCQLRHEIAEILRDSPPGTATGRIVDNG